MDEKKILYAEDDLSLIESLKYTLDTLPDGTSFDICKEVRNAGCTVTANPQKDKYAFGEEVRV